MFRSNYSITVSIKTNVPLLLFCSGRPVSTKTDKSCGCSLLTSYLALIDSSITNKKLVVILSSAKSRILPKPRVKQFLPLNDSLLNVNFLLLSYLLLNLSTSTWCNDLIFSVVHQNFPTVGRWNETVVLSGAL